MSKNRYRVAFDAKRAFNNGTGLGNYSRFIILSLLELSEYFDYFAFTPKVKKKYLFETPDSSLKIILPTTSFYKFLWRSFFIVKELKKQGVHLFHGLSNEIPFGLKKNNIKSVVTIHDLIFLHFPNQYPLIDRFIYGLKFRYAAKKADIIIAVSKQTKTDLEYFYQIPSHKIKVIYQDCDASFKKSLSQNEIEQVKQKYSLDQPYILCVGSIIERKNQLTLLKAFEKIKDNHYQLIFVGSKSSYQSELENYIQANRLQNVFISNNVSFQDLPALYQGADLFVYPSIYEGFGIPILEALYSGVPVIAAKGSCLEETGGEGALYFNATDEVELHEQILKITTDALLRQQLIENGKQHLLNFLPHKIALQVQKIYKDLLITKD